MTILSVHIDTQDRHAPLPLPSLPVMISDPLVALWGDYVARRDRALDGLDFSRAAQAQLTLIENEILRTPAASMDGVAVKLRFAECVIDRDGGWIDALLAGAIRDIERLTAKTRN